jgi:predicted nucleotidyltransferase component of viral defense system
MGEPSRLAKKQQRTLDQLKELETLRRFYLAGGTAVGVHLGHRVSLDLDLFSLDDEVDLEAVRRELSKRYPEAKVVSITDAAMTVRLDETEVDIVRYPYPPIGPLVTEPLGFPLASLEDLAAMKLSAIARRGIRRDFWDLHEILHSRRGPTLTKAAQAYLRRFGRTEADLYHVARALTYFDDAEKEATFPAGLTRRKWSQIKRFFRAQAPELLSSLADAE